MPVRALHRRLDDLYDDYRDAALSKKYYAGRLQFVKHVNLLLDVTLALAASSTFASAKIFTQTHIFAVVSPYGAGLVAALAVAKPLLALDREIERLSRLNATFSEVVEQLRQIVVDIAIEEHFSDAQQWLARSLKASVQKLASVEDPRPAPRRLRRLKTEVAREIPLSALWYPATGAGRDIEGAQVPDRRAAARRRLAILDLVSLLSLVYLMRGGRGRYRVRTASPPPG